jgi:S-adenosyl-L-methionine hydrolase (adenosine-forming)
VPLLELGTEIDPQSLATLSLSPYHLAEDGIDGTIQYVDGFGNLITNIPSQLVTEKNWWVEVGDRRIPSGNSYSDVNLGQPIALIGSHGWIEIAVNRGNAASQLQISWGDRVRVKVIPILKTE